MSLFRRQIVDGLSNLAVEVLAETVNKVSAPVNTRPAGPTIEDADYVDVDSSSRATNSPPATLAPRHGLPQTSPVPKSIPRPSHNSPRAGARPNPAYPPFPFPPPLELPPAPPASPPPSPPPAGPRARGRPRRGSEGHGAAGMMNGNGARPPLFQGNNGPVSSRLAEMTPEHDGADSVDEETKDDEEA